ncbi:hypothetical protein KEM52_003974, partial [Ascosphaera acerosa]
PAEVHGRLGVPAPLAHAPRPRAQRDDVAWPAEVGGGGGRRGQRPARQRAVVRGDACRDGGGAGVDGDGV